MLAQWVLIASLLTVEAGLSREMGATVPSAGGSSHQMSPSATRKPRLAASAVHISGRAAHPLESLPHTSPHPETDWFSTAGHGVFTHFLDSLQNDFGRNSLGQNTSWNETVAQFDVEAYAAAAAATGARYAIITMMQGTQYMIAPNAEFDKVTGYAPGEACATRDLVLDLWEALNERGLKLPLYWTGDGPHLDPRGAKAMGWQDPVTEVFVQKWASVLEEYTVRYGDKVSGWWIDGCYSHLQYNDTLLKLYHNAIRAGNPSAVIGFNNGVHHPITAPIPWTGGGEFSAWEDITCGESNDFTDVPLTRWATGPNIAGDSNITVQWHSLGYIGSQWAAPGACVCQGMQADCSARGCHPLSSTDIKIYTQSVNAVGGVLTLDLQLLRNGSMNSDQVKMLAAAWMTPRACAADFNNSTCCCDQDRACDGPVLPGKQCDALLPICQGFLYGTAYGTCST